MLLNNRVLWKNNGTIEDGSIKVNNLHALNFNLVYSVTNSDYVYIGSDHPFNHRLFKPLSQQQNDSNSTLTIETWDGTSWVACVDIIDASSNGGTGTLPLFQEGIISWVPDRNTQWVKEETTENIADMSTVKIYDKYWARFSWTTDFQSDFQLSYVGFRFSEDNDLYSWYPDLNRADVLDAFKSGKTTWSEQHITAAEVITNDLRKRNIIWSRNQVLDWEMFREGSVHKVAEIAYNAFGKSHVDFAERAAKRYEMFMNNLNFKTDKNRDATLNEFEKQTETRVIRR